MAEVTSDCLASPGAAVVAEGTSDFVALALTFTSATGHLRPRGFGYWLARTPASGRGIRQFAYSRDMPQLDRGHPQAWAGALVAVYSNLVSRYGWASVREQSGVNWRALQAIPCIAIFITPPHRYSLAGCVRADDAAVQFECPAGTRCPASC